MPKVSTHFWHVPYPLNFDVCYSCMPSLVRPWYYVHTEVDIKTTLKWQVCLLWQLLIISSTLAILFPLPALPPSVLSGGPKCFSALALIFWLIALCHVLFARLYSFGKGVWLGLPFFVTLPSLWVVSILSTLLLLHEAA